MMHFTQSLSALASSFWAIRRGNGLTQTAMDEQRYHDCSIRKRATSPPHAISDLAAQPALVVAAGPSDGVIGAGALLARMPIAGIITVADGVPLNGRIPITASFLSSVQYRRARSREATAAMALLGRKLSPCLSFAIPDQRVVFRIESIARRLFRALRTGDFKYIITHPYEGIDSDYDATALAVHAACLLLEKNNLTAPVQVEMALGKSVGDPASHRPFPTYDGAGPVETFFLSPSEQAAKRSMLECYETQRAIFSDYPLEIEQFRQAPSYNFLAPANALNDQDRIGGNRSEGSWCHTASRALYRLKLLAPT